jgi:hypothetical protein
VAPIEMFMVPVIMLAFGIPVKEILPMMVDKIIIGI